MGLPVGGVKAMNIQDLSVSERILLAEQLWESVRDEVSQSALSETQRQILDERLAALEQDGELGSSWEAVKSRVMNFKG